MAKTYTAKEIADKIKSNVKSVSKVISQYQVRQESYFWVGTHLLGRYTKDKIAFIKSKVFYQEFKK